ncbi:hypothetical protein AVEN_156162-1 [Araneus ventricosus]|uniref:Uncharacterized protein n=1 Tax=Araneus ventricosus TaxID=182803 RepID=A0A4Y2IZ94_ARAVE|nr:hypothetical protein AVEN_249476-1 [Araneus ventricosus]GBM82375.1 hypothetical protein AVEN_156162-1 [Araneus ventricosus]
MIPKRSVRNEEDGEPENVQFNVKIVQISEQKIVLIHKLMTIRELTIVNIVFSVLFCYLHSDINESRNHKRSHFTFNPQVPIVQSSEHDARSPALRVRSLNDEIFP